MPGALCARVDATFKISGRRAQQENVRPYRAVLSRTGLSRSWHRVRKSSPSVRRH